MMQPSSILYAFLFAFTAVHGLDLDYYWKDYTGGIPRDAVVVGQDLNGDNIYIGQAYIATAGILVVQIQANQTEVSAPYHGVKKSRFGIKVLCSTNQGQFSWMRSNSTRLHQDLIGKNAVIGGVENDSPIAVGRVFNNDQIKIGKVEAVFTPTPSTCYFISGNSEKASNSFEVLFNSNAIASPVESANKENVIPA